MLLSVYRYYTQYIGKSPIHTGPRTHPVSYTMDTGSFSGAQGGGGGNLAVVWLDLLPSSSTEIKESVQICLSGPSRHVLRWILPFALYLIFYSVLPKYIFL